MLPLLVEPEMLNEKLGNEGLLIIDLCNDNNYRRLHIPGAVHINPSEIISGIMPSPGKLPPMHRLEQLFNRIGYTPSKHIVAYDDEGGGWAGRFIWTLDVIGHHSMSYLNGGLIAWINAQLPLTRKVILERPTKANLKKNFSVIANKEDVMAAIGDKTIMIWDARSLEEYTGKRILAARGGHVPGAVNLDWLELIDKKNNFKLIDDIPRVIKERGLHRAKTIITHCQTHHRSGLTYFVGKLLGLNIKAYHGSWSEWGNDPKSPIEKPGY